MSKIDIQINMLTDFFDESTKIISDSSIERLSSTLENIILYLFLNKNEKQASIELSKLVDKYDFLMEVSEKLDIYNSTEKIQSYYLGYIESIMQVIKLKNEFEEKRVIVEKISRTKYLPEFLEMLYHEDVMSFNSIYIELMKINKSLTKSSLSNFLSRIEKYKFYDKKTHGKHTYYIITKNGREAYRQFCSQSRRHIDSKSFTEFELLQLDLITCEIINQTYNAHCILNTLKQSNPEVCNLLEKPNTYEEKIHRLLDASRQDDSSKEISATTEDASLRTKNNIPKLSNIIIDD